MAVLHFWAVAWVATGLRGQFRRQVECEREQVRGIGVQGGFGGWTWT